MNSDQKGGGGRYWGKEGEGSSKGIQIEDSWTWTMGRGLTLGGGVGISNRGKLGATRTEEQ